MNPLCGFRGRKLSALSKISMLVFFDYINNTRIEDIMFDIALKWITPIMQY